MTLMTETDPRKALRAAIIPTDRRVRVEFNGTIIADSTNVVLLRESEIKLYYFFPLEDVQMQFLEKTEHTTPSGLRGDTVHWTLKVGNREAENAAWMYANVPEGRPDTRGFIAFEWNLVDAWYEEDERVYGHPRDPFHRIDTIQSSRNVRVEIDGVTIADTNQAVLLFETGLPTRYYIPREDVKMELLTPTELHTVCPIRDKQHTIQ